MTESIQGLSEQGVSSTGARGARGWAVVMVLFALVEFASGFFLSALGWNGGAVVAFCFAVVFTVAGGVLVWRASRAGVVAVLACVLLVLPGFVPVAAAGGPSYAPFLQVSPYLPSLGSTVVVSAKDTISGANLTVDGQQVVMQRLSLNAMGVTLTGLSGGMHIIVVTVFVNGTSFPIVAPLGVDASFTPSAIAAQVAGQTRALLAPLAVNLSRVSSAQRNESVDAVALRAGYFDLARTVNELVVNVSVARADARGARVGVEGLRGDVVTLGLLVAQGTGVMNRTNAALPHIRADVLNVSERMNLLAVGLGNVSQHFDERFTDVTTTVTTTVGNTVQHDGDRTRQKLTDQQDSTRATLDMEQAAIARSSWFTLGGAALMVGLGCVGLYVTFRELRGRRPALGAPRGPDDGMGGGPGVVERPSPPVLQVAPRGPSKAPASSAPVSAPAVVEAAVPAPAAVAQVAEAPAAGSGEHVWQERARGIQDACGLSPAVAVVVAAWEALNGDQNKVASALGKTQNTVSHQIRKAKESGLTFIPASAAGPARVAFPGSTSVPVQDSSSARAGA